jgi:hypothetical protein
MGESASMVIENIRDVIGFDTMVVTALHRFRDVFQYYSDMSGSCDQRLLALVSLDRRIPNSTPPQESFSPNKKSASPDPSPNPDPCQDDLIPFVCLETVFRDACSANNLEIFRDSDSTDASTNTSHIPKSNPSPRHNPNASPNVDSNANSSPYTNSNASPSPCGFSLPLLSLQSADDPIIHIDTSPCRSGKPYPNSIPTIHVDISLCMPIKVKSNPNPNPNPTYIGIVDAIDNLICLVTSVGGHVGWPLGKIQNEYGYS